MSPGPKNKPAATGAEGTSGVDFEAAIERLDEIVRRLESGDVALDEAIRLFEEGLTLSQQCGKLLDGAQARIEKLVASVEALDAQNQANFDDIEDAEVDRSP